MSEFLPTLIIPSGRITRDRAIEIICLFKNRKLDPKALNKLALEFLPYSDSDLRNAWKRFLLNRRFRKPLVTLLESRLQDVQDEIRKAGVYYIYGQGVELDETEDTVLGFLVYEFFIQQVRS